jgi:predicted ArsR family transcriptional regulator
MTTPDESLTALAVLADDLRGRLYAFIRATGRPVTREEAAASTGISRKLAAFHLDKLVEAGLLRARYDTRGGLRRAGRTPKTYEPAAKEIHVSIPPRHHDVLADILLDAVLAENSGQSARHAAMRIARARGGEFGGAARQRLRPGRLGAERALTLVGQILEGCGFEPAREGPALLTLRNCPFHPLAAKAPDLVCGINHAYLSGLADGLGAATIEAVLAPGPDRCCVQLTERGARIRRHQASR